MLTVHETMTQVMGNDDWSFQTMAQLVSIRWENPPMTFNHLLCCVFQVSVLLWVPRDGPSKVLHINAPATKHYLVPEYK